MIDRKTVNPTMAQITTAVAAEFGLTASRLTSPSRKHAQPRFAAYVLCRETGASFEAIGRHFHRDHSSVCHGVRRAAELEGHNAKFAEHMGNLRPSFGRMMFRQSTAKTFVSRRAGQ